MLNMSEVSQVLIHLKYCLDVTINDKCCDVCWGTCNAGGAKLNDVHAEDDDVGDEDEHALKHVDDDQCDDLVHEDDDDEVLKEVANNVLAY